MRIFIAFAAAVLLGAPAARADDPVGQYAVNGNNPGGGPAYRGAAVVQRTGETYRVMWIIGNQRIEGTAIGDKSFLTVTYRFGDQIGLAFYASTKDGNWQGVWTFTGATQLGAEHWERQ
jgi:hypothetical protein